MNMIDRRFYREVTSLSRRYYKYRRGVLPLLKASIHTNQHRSYPISYIHINKAPKVKIDVSYGLLYIDGHRRRRARL